MRGVVRLFRMHAYMCIHFFSFKKVHLRSNLTTYATPECVFIDVLYSLYQP